MLASQLQSRYCFSRKSTLADYWLQSLRPSKTDVGSRHGSPAIKEATDGSEDKGEGIENLVRSLLEI